jgi:hypothetical protein
MAPALHDPGVTFLGDHQSTAEIQYAEETPAGVTGLRRVFVELYSPKMLLHLSETGFRQIGSASPER